MLKTFAIIMFIAFYLPFNTVAQSTDFRKELREKQFHIVKKKNLTPNIIKLLGCNNLGEIGTDMVESGCVSGRRIILNWGVSDRHGFYIFRIATCGAWTETRYYIISDHERYEIEIQKDADSFEEFRKIYIP